MPELEDQGTSTLPREWGKTQPAPPFVGINVDADLPATISRVVQRQTLLTETYGAENTAANLARETSLQNARRVELLTQRLTRNLSAAESRELEVLQASEGARFGARLRADNERLKRLLQS